MQNFVVYEELLREIGFSKNEARVYEALLQIGEASVQEISNRSRVHRRNVYDSMQKLLEKGLVLEVFIKGDKHFKAVNPRRLLELLEEKEERINSVLPEMQAKYESIGDKEEAYLYRGIEGFKNYLQDILKTKETVSHPILFHSTQSVTSHMPALLLIHLIVFI